MTHTHTTSCIAHGARQCSHTVLGFGATLGVFVYFRCKTWRHILARRPQFPIKATKFRAYLA